MRYRHIYYPYLNIGLTIYSDLIDNCIEYSYSFIEVTNKNQSKVKTKLPRSYRSTNIKDILNKTPKILLLSEEEKISADYIDLRIISSILQNINSLFLHSLFNNIYQSILQDL
jgi:hypothetical protein